MEALRKDNWTYETYCKITDGRRYEVIDGVIYAMGPAPGYVHQGISVELSRRIGNYLESKPCRIFHAPFDVCFPAEGEKDEDSRIVVQPDLLVLCDTGKLRGTGCVGAPDLVIEILSPSSARMDMIIKRNLYEKNSVPEYWIIDPKDCCVVVLRLENGRYGEPIMVHEDEPLTSDVLPGLTIDLRKIFTDSVTEL